MGAPVNLTLTSQSCTSLLLSILIRRHSQHVCPMNLWVETFLQAKMLLLVDGVQVDEVFYIKPLIPPLQMRTAKSIMTIRKIVAILLQIRCALAILTTEQHLMVQETVAL